LGIGKEGREGVGKDGKGKGGTGRGGRVRGEGAEERESYRERGGRAGLGYLPRGHEFLVTPLLSLQ